MAKGSSSCSKKEQMPPPSRSFSASVMRKVQSLDSLTIQRLDGHYFASKYSQAFSKLQRSSSFGSPDRPARGRDDSALDEKLQNTTGGMNPSSSRSPWTLVSMCMLLLLSLNLGLQHVQARNPMEQQPQQQGSLGSAAIASITESLSPILPFTGGVDLRREFDDSSKSWYDAASSAVNQMYTAFGMQAPGKGVFSIPRGGGASSSSASTKVAIPNKRTKMSSSKQYTSSISDSKPFLALNKIADLNLSDLTDLFEYAVKQNQVDFDQSRFLSKMNDKVKYAVEQMDAAVKTSRGSTNILSISPEEATTGNVDALYFCAILRIFAEWRILRQVPQGYKGYAVGMNLGHKDIVQNLAKMETAVHSYLQYYDKSPTLRDLLQHEIDSEVHSKLPRLKEKSAAMGLLWVRRQLQYQTCLFGNILQVPSPQYPTTQKAVSAAYFTVYGDYHGWAVQKIFNYSFQAAPDVTEIYKFMNPSLLEKVLAKSKRIVVDDENEDNGMTSSTRDDSTKQNPLVRIIHHVGNEFDKLGRELDKFGRHIGSEWDKLVDSIVRVFDQDSERLVSQKPQDRIRGGADDSLSNSNQQAAFVVQHMKQDAHARISRYLVKVEPLLDDLADLFDDLNMDDPTKV